MLATVPVAAALAVVIRDHQVLLVRRAHPPDAGLWGFPRGKIEFGEPVIEAAVRELLEETGVAAGPECVLTAVDAIERSGDGIPQHHYVLAAVLCTWRSGEPCAGDDALEVAWFRMDALPDESLAASVGVRQLAEDGAELAEQFAERSPNQPRSRA